MRKTVSILCLCILAIVPFAPEWQVAGVWITAADIMMIFAITLSPALLLHRSACETVSFPLLLPLGLLLTTMVVSCTHAVLPVAVIREFLKYILILSFFYVMVNVLTRDSLLRLPYVMTLSVLVLGVWFLIDIRLGNYTPWDRLWHRKLLPTYHLNSLGTLFVIAIPFAAMLIANAKSIPAKLGAVAALILQIIGLFLTYSRANWIAFFIVAVAFAVFRYKLKGLIGVLVILIVPFLVLGKSYPEIRLNDRLYSIADRQEGSIVSRKEHIAAALYMIKRQPLTGVGLGNFQIFAERRMNRQLTEMVHNVLLQFGAETGVFSMLIILVIGCCYYVEAFKILARVRSDTELHAVLLLSIVSFTGLMISSQFGDPFVRGIKEYFILTLALPYAIHNAYIKKFTVN